MRSHSFGARKNILHPCGPLDLGELKFYPQIQEGLELIKKLGFLRILVTNQPDVSYGYTNQKNWEPIQAEIEKLKFDAIKICRHARDANCLRKKPSPKMLVEAADDFGIDLKSSYMIGDTDNDTLAGQQAGCKTILLTREYNEEVEADYRAGDFLGAAQLIEILEKKSKQP